MMNKVINGHQCTISWHINDLKISHVDKDVIKSIVTKLEACYGKEALLTVT